MNGLYDCITITTGTGASSCLLRCRFCTHYIRHFLCNSGNILPDLQPRHQRNCMGCDESYLLCGKESKRLYYKTQGEKG